MKGNLKQGTKWIVVVALVVGLTILVGGGAAMTLAQELERQSRSAQPAAAAPTAERSAQIQTALGTGFTYQAQLKQGGSPVNGSVDLQFSLWDAASSGSQIGTTQTKASVAVSDGVFSVELDFGSGAFPGDARWLQIAVSAAGAGSYTTLSPRQALTPVPYALGLRLPFSEAYTLTAPIFTVRNPQSSLTYSSTASSLLALSGSGTITDTNGRSYAAGIPLSNAAAGKFAGHNGLIGAASSDFSDGYGVVGISKSQGGGRGVYGVSPVTTTSAVNFGVYGEAYSLTSLGGYFTNNAGSGYGVVAVAGEAPWVGGVGVQGISGSGRVTETHPNDWFWDGGGEFVGPNGVIGAASADASDGAGVIGVAQGSSGYGVLGSATSLTGVADGVWGETESSSGRGVAGYAWSDTGTTSAVYGRSYSSSGRGVYGWASSSSGTNYGVYGRTDSSAGWSGYFTTSVGNGLFVSTPSAKAGLIVSGGNKSAVVPTNDGSRLLYSEEATEVWFADYGFGRLQNGEATVAIDPLFAQTVNLSQPYHVFVQSYGDAEVYVINRTATQFKVKLRAGDPTVEFSFRIVAKRLGHEDDRLERAPQVESTAGRQPEGAVPTEKDRGQRQERPAMPVPSRPADGRAPGTASGSNSGR